jgi:hypothetical protein
MASPGVDAKKYGTAAGYSEDYGMRETKLEPVLAEDDYNNGTRQRFPQQQQQPPQQQPAQQSRNPFTQQQAQGASTNPFAR